MTKGTHVDYCKDSIIFGPLYHGREDFASFWVDSQQEPMLCRPALNTLWHVPRDARQCWLELSQKVIRESYELIIVVGSVRYLWHHSNECHFDGKELCYSLGRRLEATLKAYLPRTIVNASCFLVHARIHVK